jgi:hypothetical protein
MKARIKLVVVAGVAVLLASGLPFSCEGISPKDPDGEGAIAASWAAVSSSGFGTYYIDALAYGGGIFVAGGGSGNGDGKMAYSTNGIDWKDAPNSGFEKSYIDALAYGGGVFVAGGGGGKTAYSTDGKTWTAATTVLFGASHITALAYGGNTFVVGSESGELAYSADGISWTGVGKSGTETGNAETGNAETEAGNAVFGASAIYALAYGGDRFVAGGEGGKRA